MEKLFDVKVYISFKKICHEIEVQTKFSRISFLLKQIFQGLVYV